MSEQTKNDSWLVLVRLDGDVAFSLDSDDMTLRTTDPQVNQRVTACLEKALKSIAPGQP